MRKERSVTFNFIMNFILTASSFIFPLITSPYVFRVLLPVGNGKVAFATAVITYFSMVSMLGIPTYGIRACAQVRDDKEKLSRTVQEILIINGIMTVLVYIAFGISLQVVPQFAEEKALLWVMSATILLNVIGVSWLYSALEQYAYITAVSLVFKMVGVILMFLFVHDIQDYVIYGGITVISNVGSSVLNFLRLGRYITLKPVGNYDLKKHWKPIAVFCAMTVATSIYTNLDIVMLRFISGDEQTGYYNAAVKIKLIVSSLVTSLGAVLLPRLSYYIEKGMKEEFQRMASKALSFVTMMALPMVVYFMMFARESIRFLSGLAYELAVPSMCIIMPTVVFIGLSNILGMQILIPTDQEKKVLNLILIPKLGASGAAIGTLAAEFTVVLVQAVMLWDFLKKIRREYHVLPYILALLPAFVASALLRELILDAAGNFLTLAVTAVVFFGIYGGVLLLLKESIIVEFVLPYVHKILHIGTRNTSV